MTAISTASRGSRATPRSDCIGVPAALLLSRIAAARCPGMCVLLGRLRVFADDDLVFAAALLLERGRNDAVNAVRFRHEPDTRVQVLARRVDVVVLGEHLAFGVYQPQVRVELLTVH